jgi:hypothetical protein
MWYSQLNLLRYLFIFRINSTLVCIPKYPAAEFSLVIGQAIADLLPSTQARAWRKSLASWDSCGGLKLSEKREFNALPQAPWPVHSVIMPYPDKRSYGKDELFMWELKLFGQGADPDIIPEILIPALEQLGTTTDPRWQYPNSMWGHFDLHSAHIALGNQWKPLVNQGRLNLDYRPDPLSWARNLKFDVKSKRSRDRLTWITPYAPIEPDIPSHGIRKLDKAPSLAGLMEALILRMSGLLKRKSRGMEEFWDYLEEKEQEELREALRLASHIPVVNYRPDPLGTYFPGGNCGNQTFSTRFPDMIRPYLGIASLFHIGEHTHYGWGTFVIN